MSAVLTLQSLPLFPLSAVLFPGGVLPLRIFEVRYLDMIGRCHKAGAPFGVVSITQGQEVRRPGSAEAFSEIGTLATISDFKAPRPGLMVINAVGVHRFRITSREQLRHGLWIADVQGIGADMTVPVPEDLQYTAQALAKLIDGIRSGAPDRLQMAFHGPLQMEDCGWVANRWCELLPLPIELRQRLMALENPLVRLELVSDVLARTGIVG